MPAGKWMQAARKRMKRKGTTGSLRAIAQKRGLVKGEKDKLTASDLRTLHSSATKSGNTALMKKVQFAASAMKVSLPKAKEK